MYNAEYQKQIDSSSINKIETVANILKHAFTLDYTYGKDDPIDESQIVYHDNEIFMAICYSVLLIRERMSYTRYARP